MCSNLIIWGAVAQCLDDESKKQLARTCRFMRNEMAELWSRKRMWLKDILYGNSARKLQAFRDFLARRDLQGVEEVLLAIESTSPLASEQNPNRHES